MEEVGVLTAIIERVLKLMFKIAPFIKKRIDKKKIPNEAYFFDEYNKKVFVKSNGDGVIVASIMLHVNDPEKTTHLIRTFDISDAKKGTEFPSIDELLQKGGANPFSDYGFWYSSDNGIVTDITEEYVEEDFNRKTETRFLSVKIQLNDAALEKDKSYKIIYALSVPGLYPIKDGRFDGTVQQHEEYGKFITSVSTYQTHKKLTYSVYMDKDIVFSKKPKAYCKGKTTQGEAKPNNCEYRNNMFYEKFNFTLDNPQEYDIIYMQWDLKNQKTVNKTCTLAQNIPESTDDEETEMAVANADVL